jgi:hypothetical protein
MKTILVFLLAAAGLVAQTTPINNAQIYGNSTANGTLQITNNGTLEVTSGSNLIGDSGSNITLNGLSGNGFVTTNGTSKITGLAGNANQFAILGAGDYPALLSGGNSTVAGWNGTGQVMNLTLDGNLAISGNILGLAGVITNEFNGTLGNATIPGGAVLTGNPVSTATFKNDVNYTVLATDSWVAYHTITASRSVTLPAASGVPDGYTVTISDLSGNLSASIGLTIFAAGTDTINGKANLTLKGPYSTITLASDGTSIWEIKTTSWVSVSAESYGFGDGAFAAGAGVAIGGGAQGGSDSIVIGYEAGDSSAYVETVAIGDAARAGSYGVSLGSEAGDIGTPTESAVTIGKSAMVDPTANGGIAIGYDAVENGNMTANGNAPVIIGTNALAQSSGGINIGMASWSIGHDSVTIGGIAQSRGDQSTSIGDDSEAFIQNDLVIGGELTPGGNPGNLSEANLVSSNQVFFFNGRAADYWRNVLLTGGQNTVTTPSNSPVQLHGADGLDARTLIYLTGPSSAHPQQFLGIGEVSGGNVVGVSSIPISVAYNGSFTVNALGGPSATGFAGTAVNGTINGSTGQVASITITSNGSGFTNTLHDQAGGPLWLDGGRGTGSGTGGNVDLRVAVAGTAGTNVLNLLEDGFLVTPSSNTTLPAIALLNGTLTTNGAATFESTVASSGQISTTAIGSTLAVKSGSDAKAGTFTLASGTATVSNTSVTANSVILITLKTASGTVASNYISAITAGTSFVVTGGALDNSTYNYVILEVN